MSTFLVCGIAAAVTGFAFAQPALHDGPLLAKRDFEDPNHLAVSLRMQV
jgi:hypothetical protein